MKIQFLKKIKIIKWVLLQIWRHTNWQAIWLVVHFESEQKTHSHTLHACLFLLSVLPSTLSPPDPTYYPWNMSAGTREGADCGVKNKKYGENMYWEEKQRRWQTWESHHNKTKDRWRVCVRTRRDVQRVEPSLLSLYRHSLCSSLHFQAHRPFFSCACECVLLLLIASPWKWRGVAR